MSVVEIEAKLEEANIKHKKQIEKVQKEADEKLEELHEVLN